MSSKASHTNKTTEVIAANDFIRTRQNLKLNALLDITKEINNNRSEQDLYRIFDLTLMGLMSIKKMLIFYKQDKWKKVYQKGGDNDNYITFNPTCLDYEDVVLLRDTSLEEKEDFDLLIPVFHKDNALAFVFLSSPDLSNNIELSDEVRFIKTITNVIIVAIENKYLFKRQIEQATFKKEIEVAEKVQTMLVPKKLPQRDWVTMDAIYKPHHNIGGDYYDVIPVSEKEVVICIADVSGKGIGAAMLMSNFQATVRAYAKEDLFLTDLIQKLNNRVFEVTEGESFITFFIAKYNTQTHQAFYINAGHPPPVIVHNNTITELSSGSTLLGAFEELPFVNEGEYIMKKNSFGLLYTDGLTDIVNEKGDFFETEQLYEFILKQKNYSPRHFNQNLLQELNTFKGKTPYTDDISVLAWQVF